MQSHSSQSAYNKLVSIPCYEAFDPNYAFLVHSQNTLTQNLPPKVDNKMLNRQKRRRTRYLPAFNTPLGFFYLREYKLLILRSLCSPDDQAILEVEYRKNSKPDKTARSDIVSKVALGEKEVQACYQSLPSP